MQRKSGIQAESSRRSSVGCSAWVDRGDGTFKLSSGTTTLRVYAHAMREEETDLSFAEFGVEPAEKRMAIGAPKRPYTAPASGADFLESDTPLIPMARREGFDAVGLRPT